MTGPRRKDRKECPGRCQLLLPANLPGWAQAFLSQGEGMQRETSLMDGTWATLWRGRPAGTHPHVEHEPPKLRLAGQGDCAEWRGGDCCAEQLSLQTRDPG